jgi:Nitroreductase
MNTNLIATKSVSPWEITAEDFPAYGSSAAKWKLFLCYAVLAPSSHNTQPWRFHIRHNRLELLAERTRACPVVDPDDRELIMSCGCALFHLITAMKHFCCFGGVEIWPVPGEPDLLAVVTLGVQDESVSQQGMLFDAITTRRTNRQPLHDSPVPGSTIGALELAAKRHAAWLYSCLTSRSNMPSRIWWRKAIGCSGPIRHFAWSWPNGCFPIIKPGSTASQVMRKGLTT